MAPRQSPRLRRVAACWSNGTPCPTSQHDARVANVGDVKGPVGGASFSTSLETQTIGQSRARASAKLGMGGLNPEEV